MGKLLATAAPNGLEPISAISTEPEANAVKTSAPLLNKRQSSFSPITLSYTPSACATLAGSMLV